MYVLSLRDEIKYACLNIECYVGGGVSLLYFEHEVRCISIPIVSLCFFCMIDEEVMSC